MQKSEILYMMVDILLFGSFFNKVGNIQKLISRFWFYLSCQIRFFNIQAEENKIDNLRSSAEDKYIDGEIIFRREEVEMVMENLGIFCSQESDEKLKEVMGFDELSKLFDEKEPSLEEIKESFDVFDLNRDGFIDAEELRRVILLLGLKEGSDVENCRKMIRNFDENRDGRIDFNEFVKFMENNLS